MVNILSNYIYILYNVYNIISYYAILYVYNNSNYMHSKGRQE